MIRAALAVALLCALTIGAEARPAAVPCSPLFEAIHLCSKEITPQPNKRRHKSRFSASKEITPSYGAPSPSFGYSIGRPVRYIAGRLICALNVNAALAE